jgi:uncharacterized membrane protein YkgB
MLVFFLFTWIQVYDPVNESWSFRSVSILAVLAIFMVLIWIPTPFFVGYLVTKMVRFIKNT